VFRNCVWVNINGLGPRLAKSGHNGRRAKMWRICAGVKLMAVCEQRRKWRARSEQQRRAQTLYPRLLGAKLSAPRRAKGPRQTPADRQKGGRLFEERRVMRSSHGAHRRHQLARPRFYRSSLKHPAPCKLVMQSEERQ
jgi:hypothetical protein